jgi:hypothetical protein
MYTKLLQKIIRKQRLLSLVEISYRDDLETGFAENNAIEISFKLTLNISVLCPNFLIQNLRCYA